MEVVKKKRVDKNPVDFMLYNNCGFFVGNDRCSSGGRRIWRVGAN